MQINLLPTPFSEPESVFISTAADNLKPGPSDDRINTVIPDIPKKPYNYPFMPPFDGKTLRADLSAVEVNSIVTEDPRYCSVNAYGTVRFALDMWEKYFKRPVSWWFEEYYDQLELITPINSNNAHAGYGYIELGHSDYDNTPFALNHDVIVHELGHLVVYAEIWLPDNPQQPLMYYYGLHETIADLSAVLSLLHFKSQQDETLRISQGNLFTLNPISRIGKLARKMRQIRVAPNCIQLRDLKDCNNPNVFELPLLGLFYDLLAVIFQRKLFDAGLISYNLYDKARILTTADNTHIQNGFAESYQGKHEQFRIFLVEARDLLGSILASIMQQVTADDLNYSDVFTACLTADHELTGGIYEYTIVQLAKWRGIAVNSNSRKVYH